MQNQLDAYLRLFNVVDQQYADVLAALSIDGNWEQMKTTSYQHRKDKEQVLLSFAKDFIDGSLDGYKSLDLSAKVIDENGEIIPIQHAILDSYKNNQMN